MSAASPLGLVLDVSAVPPNPAGAGRYILELTRALGREGELDLFLVTRRGDTARFSTLAPGARLLELVPPSRPGRLLYERLLLARHVDSVAGGPGPVYHAPHYTMPSGLDRPVVVTVHDLTFFDHPEWHEARKVAFFRAAIRRAVREADVVVCVSATTAARLASLADVRAELVVAEHGVDHERFRPGEADLSVIPAPLSEVPFVLHVGTIEPRKNLLQLLHAAEAVGGARHDLHLVFAGQPGWAKGELDNAIRKSPIRSRVHELGFVEDETLVALMRAAAVIAYPSHEEGFGLPALEAMAVGARLVTASGTTMEEYAGVAAYSFPAGDEAGLAAALAAALDAPAEEADRRRQAGIERAASFTWEETARRHLAAYRLAGERYLERPRHS